jgi:abortive infection bacteriophage resistance protein
MTFVATKEISQVFVIQKGTIEKYKNKWRETVKKYYEVILPEQKEREIEMLGIDGDIM